MLLTMGAPYEDRPMDERHVVHGIVQRLQVWVCCD